MTADNRTTNVVSDIMAIAKERNAEVTGMSWSGFNLIGDRASIMEVQRLMSCESILRALERRIKEAGVKL